jgi:hypothetical protein
MGRRIIENKHSTEIEADSPSGCMGRRVIDKKYSTDVGA